MFKYLTGWWLSADILRLATEHPQHCSNELHAIVRDEIAQDRQLVWC